MILEPDLGNPNIFFSFLTKREKMTKKIYFCRSSEDLIHRLFVCIAGVADQLQTNFAGDLRNILKAVFSMNATETESEDEAEEKDNSSSPNSSGRNFLLFN